MARRAGLPGDFALVPPPPTSPRPSRAAPPDLFDSLSAVSDQVTVPAATASRGVSVIRAGLLSMVGLVALGGTRLVHGSLVSRATDQETYGLVGSLIGLAMTVSLFLPGGLASAASRFIPFHRGGGDEAAARSAYRVLTLAGYACAIGLGVNVGLIATALDGVTVGDAVAVGLLAAVFSAYSVAKSALYGFDRVVPYTWLEIAGSVVAIGATVVVVATGSRAYLMPLTLGYAVLMLGALAVLRRRRRTPSGLLRLDLKEMAVYVGLASLGGLASAGLLQALPVVASRFTTLTEVSYVAAAVTLVAPLYFLPRALSMALFPAMAKAHGAGDGTVVRRHADVFTRALLVVLAPVFAVGVLISPEVLTLFGGGEYARGAGVLRVVLLATYVAVVQVAAVNALSSGDGFRIPVWASVVGAVVGLVVVVPLGWWLGGIGVALAYLVAVVVGAGVPLGVVWRRFELAWTGPAARSVAVVLAAVVVAPVLDTLGWVGAGRAGIDVAAALGLAAAGAWLLRRDIAAILAVRHTL
jgi:O-antigen/teichoic acid export membrane protein